MFLIVRASRTTQYLFYRSSLSRSEWGTYDGRVHNATAVCDTLTSQREGWYVTDGVWGMILALSNLVGVGDINHEYVFQRL